MKRNPLLPLVLLSLFLSSSLLASLTLDPSASLKTLRQRPDLNTVLGPTGEGFLRNDDFLSVFTCQGYPVTEETSLRELNQIAQRDFLRPAGTERSDIPPEFIYKFKNMHFFLWNHLSNLGFAQPVPMKFKEPAVIAICGARVSTMIKRINFVTEALKKRQWSKESTQVVLLTSDRPLEEFERQDFPWPENILPKTEGDAAEALWNSLNPGCPCQNLQAKGMVKDGKYKRPTTLDNAKSLLTIDYFKTMDLLVREIAVISNNPYIPYQAAQFEQVIYANHPLFPSENMQFSGPGYEKSPEDAKKLALAMDAFARTLYVIHETLEELRRKEAQNS